jgi:hypothetical protein
MPRPPPAPPPVREEIPALADPSSPLLIASYRPDWTEYEKEELAHLRGASKNHYARLKFQHDVKLLPTYRADGSHVLMNNAVQRPLAVLPEDHAYIFTENPHLRQATGFCASLRLSDLRRAMPTDSACVCSRMSWAGQTAPFSETIVVGCSRACHSRREGEHRPSTTGDSASCSVPSSSS